MTRRIDVHQHIVPPFYADLLQQRSMNGGWAVPSWSTDAALAMMDDQEIEIGILSLSAPGANVGDDPEARTLARKVNEYVASVVRGRPDRFGQFATLPLPDVQAALDEAVFALDELGVAGVVLLTNARGQYLGDPALEPLWELLAARRAVVYIHPAAPPGPGVPGLPAAIVDFPADTVRTAVQLTMAGVVTRHPSLPMILSHGGGFLPFCAHRFANAIQLGGFGLTYDEALGQLRSFYLETALTTTPTALPSLLAFADPERLLYGTDWPFLPHDRVAHFNRLLAHETLPDQVERAIARGNAERLLARLPARGTV